MSLFNPATKTNTGTLPAPVIELRGLAAKNDLSAWIGGAMLAIGISRIGPTTIANDYQNGGFGFYLIVASYVAFIASVLLLQRAMKIRLSAKEFGVPQSLVTTGIFKFSRNPIYLAFFMPLASLAYFSLETAIASIVIYVTAMNLTVIRKEERELLGFFGKTYATYRNEVPRWFA